MELGPMRGPLPVLRGCFDLGYERRCTMRGQQAYLRAALGRIACLRNLTALSVLADLPNRRSTELQSQPPTCVVVRMICAIPFRAVGLGIRVLRSSPCETAMTDDPDRHKAKMQKRKAIQDAEVAAKPI